MVIGILALQGCVEPHAEKLRALGVDIRFVRKSEHLQGIAGLILPGGESTTISRLLEIHNMITPLRELARTVPFWGVCAGSILMAKSIQGKTGPHQLRLELIRMCVERNSYGRQLESFRGVVKLVTGESVSELPFIRAPKFSSIDPEVEVLGRVGEEKVFLKDGIHIVTSFHPELSDSTKIHALFLELCDRTRARNIPAPPPASI